MNLFDVDRTFEVSERSGNLENSIVRSRAEIEAFHGLFESSFAAFVEPAVLRDEAATHVGVAKHVRFRSKSLQLDGSSFFDALADHGR